MNFERNKLLSYSFFLQVLHFCGTVIAHHEECSDILWKSKNPQNETYSIFNGDTQRILGLLPLTISFSQPVEIVTAEFLDAELIKPKQWVLSHLENVSDIAYPKQISIAVFSEFNPVEITEMQSNTGTEVHCSGDDEVEIICGIGGELDLRAEKILLKKAAWSSGRNYQLKIPSYPTFVGFAVDIFFDGPVTDIQVPPSRAKAVEITPKHWILAGEYTGSACVKLIDIFFAISYDEKRDIVAILLNGEAVLGTGKSVAVLRNMNLDSEMNTDCEGFFTKHVDPWYNPHGEKARSLWFTAKTSLPKQVGIVMDIIFEDNVKEVRLWELKAEKLEEHHWRVVNPGIIVSPNEEIRFPVAIYFYQHYHVKIIGIKMNDQILCGLGAKATVIVEEENVPESDELKNQTLRVETFYSYLLVSVILVAVSMLFTILIFALIFIRKMKETLRKRRHLYDFPARQLPTDSVNNYATINDSTNTVDTCVSQM